MKFQEKRIIFSKKIYYLKDYKIFAPELMEQKYTENNNKKLCSK